MIHTSTYNNQCMVIYSLFQWEVCRKEILSKVTSEDFTHPYNNYFDELTKAIHDNTIDNQSFKIEYMSKRSELLQVKGNDWRRALDEMINDGVRRRLRTYMMMCSGMIDDSSVPMNEINQELTKLKVLSEDSRLYIKPVRTSKDLMVSTLNKLEDIAKGEHDYARWGIDSLDEICQTSAGDFNVIAARSGLGKSIMAHNCLLGAAIHQKVGYWCAEMDEAMIGMRMISSDSSVPLQKLKTRDMSQGETQLMLNSIKTIQGLKDNLFISTGENSRGDTVEDLVRWIEKLVGSHGVKHVFLDYLQRIKATDSRIPRREQVSHIAYTLKTCAQNLGITITALAQLNRVAAGERPQIHHLAESGMIEQEASVIILLDRIGAGEDAKSRKYMGVQDGTESKLIALDATDLMDKIIIIIGKNRNGAKKILYHDIDMPTLKIGDKSRFYNGQYSQQQQRS